MKRISLLALAAVAALPLAAQSIYYQDAGNKDMLRHTHRVFAQRSEIILPNVNGYKVLKADLHTHTIFSDGDVHPEYRVREAYTDGLDVLSITDHVEYRRWEGQMVSFLKGYYPEAKGPVNDNVMGKAAGEQGILTDLNLPYNVSRNAAANYGITLIPGVEITRDPLTVGHYNALFVQDANTVYDPDPLQSIKKAREQGAVIMQNHPGWRRKNLDMIEFERKVYEQNLIDGVEIMNGGEFYPTVIGRASEKKFFMAANTDIHSTTARDYNNVGHMRNMTLILARDQKPESVKEALLARRTLAYSMGTIAGEEKLVRDFFNACIQYETLSEKPGEERHVRMHNPTSLTWVICFGGNPERMLPFSSRDFRVKRDKAVKFTVQNLWVPGEKQHPEFSVDYHTLSKP